MLNRSTTAIGRDGRRATFLLAAGLLALLAGSPSQLLAQTPPEGEADILITNGKVIDGTGSPWRQANVAIKGDTIVYIGNAPVKAKKVINVSGQAITPGFIDMHAHSEFGLSLDGRGLSMITQGVTTEVVGEHLSAGPVLGPAVDDPMMVTPPVKRSWTTLGGFFDYLTKKGIGPNVVSYVGAGQVRASVMGYENRNPTPAEMDRMKQLIVQAMHEGAFGLSAGLVYVPNSFDSTAQMIELAKVAAVLGGIYSVHMRAGEGNAGVLETVQIAKGAHIPTEIFHVGMTVARNPEFAHIVEHARAQGIDITANAYPYTVGWTYVRQLIPVWAQEGNAAAITARLQQPDVRARVVKELQQKPGQYAAWTVSSANPKFDGHTFKQIADSLHEPVEEAMVDFLVTQKAEGFQIGPADPSMDQKEAETFKLPWVDVGSDGIALPAGVHTAFGRPHPRSFGTFTHILADVVRDRHILTLEEAVHKMTAQPANRLGIADRGLLRAGMKADVVVFDPATVRDTSTYAKPDQYSTGVAWVLVNGTAVVANGKPTNALPGRPLHGPAYKAGTP
jgi:N-acyl-D-aspartate/D-glutamate deacylase